MVAFSRFQNMQDPDLSSEKMSMEYERESKSGLEPGDRCGNGTTGQDPDENIN